MLPALRDNLPKPPGFSAKEKFELSLAPTAVSAPLMQMIQAPEASWRVFRDNGKSFQRVFGECVFLLALIPAVCGCIGYGLFGNVGLIAAAKIAVLGYVFSVIFVYAACWLAQGIALLLGAGISLDLSAKLVIYSMIPFFVTGVFLIHPSLAPFSLFGTFSLVLFFRGVEIMTAVSRDKRLLYCISNVVTWLLFVETVLGIIF